MYNWYAVNTGKLCPTGWHVPTDAECKTLLVAYVGAKLRESGTTHWLSPNDGTNESGFTALPGGYRNSDGFFSIGTVGIWWSSGVFDTTNGSDWYVRNFGDASFEAEPKQNGLSVRCLKD